MIKITRVNSINQPYIFCDICGEKITVAGMGTALNEYDEKGNSVVEVMYAHKGNCFKEAEKRLTAKYGSIPQWHELDKFLTWLLQNSGISPERLRELAQDDM
ncbi:hypothetical protein [Geobacter sp. SVR]|uniref:hypothetical protein n=1 Tax=Geobacter sp. SVR TaxID=2495594 RepID=UPI00143F0185|nr:hypothetical protein [Geobacter sp. SVR]BCS52645.1 hypothetical protein GSVR_09530 [Geobacter sp. SVR]GCF83918.1 hypothetical protein GSbR_05180 [Geobacter sp. SVR]